jgi:hypothetical protein
MKKFNVVLMSEDVTMQMSYFFTMKAENEEEAIQLAQNELKNIVINEWKVDLPWVDYEISKYSPQIFELKEI